MDTPASTSRHPASPSQSTDGDQNDDHPDTYKSQTQQYYQQSPPDQASDGAVSDGQLDRQLLRDKMKDIFAKIITDIDKQVLTVSESQCELDSQLDQLIATLDSIKIDERLTDEISANAKRISSLKSRLTLIHTILSNSSARCSRTLAACGAAIGSLGPAASVQTTSSSSEAIPAADQASS